VGIGSALAGGRWYRRLTEGDSLGHSSDIDGLQRLV
jgi:hypothetical protein